jgi:hypothetical protein
MSALWRARITSFLSGVAVAGAVGLYQIRKDLEASHKVLAEQGESYNHSLEERIQRLESGLAQPQGSKQ